MNGLFNLSMNAANILKWDSFHLWGVEVRNIISVEILVLECE